MGSYTFSKWMQAVNLLNAAIPCRSRRSRMPMRRRINVSAV